MIKMGFLNAGDGDVYKPWSEAMSEHDIFGTCEMLSHDNYPRRIAKDLGYKSYIGEGHQGNSACQVYWHPKTVRMLRPMNKLLLSRRYIGPGAGPDHNSPKFAVGGYFEDRETERNFWYFAVHCIPTVNGCKERVEASNIWADNLNDLLAKLTPFMCVGDYNDNPKGRVLRRVMGPDMTNNHLALGVKYTKGNRAIDMGVYDKTNKLVPVGHTTRNVDTAHGRLDHKLLTIRAELKQGKLVDAST